MGRCPRRRGPEDESDLPLFGRGAKPEGELAAPAESFGQTAVQTAAGPGLAGMDLSRGAADPKMQALFEGLLPLARDNDAEGVRAFLESGCPPNTGNRMGQTALHIGAIWGSVEAVHMLLKGGANPNIQNQLRGQTPMHGAAMGRGPADRRAECARLLIQFKGDPRKQDGGGESAMDYAQDEGMRQALGAAKLILHEAASARSAAGLAEALEKVRTDAADGIEVDTPRPGSGEAALHVAVALGWREGMGMLLVAGASSAVCDDQNRTPLHTAVLAGQWQCLPDLLAAKADPDAQDWDPEHDPRFSSTTFDQKPENHRTPLHYAASLGNVLALRQLLEAKADPNMQDSFKETALHLWLSMRDPDAEFETGAGVRVQDSGLSGCDGRLGALLGQTQASGKKCPPGNWSVLLEGDSEAVVLKEECLHKLPSETLEALLGAGADVNLGSYHTGETRTLLHQAARQGDAVLAARAIDVGAVVDQQDEKLGFTALHIAARSKHHDVVALLLERRASAELRTAGGRTAAELAETNGAPAATVALLRGDGSDGSIANKTSGEAPAQATKAQKLGDLTPEQRAMLFID